MPAAPPEDAGAAAAGAGASNSPGPFEACARAGAAGAESKPKEEDAVEDAAGVEVMVRLLRKSMPRSVAEAFLACAVAAGCAAEVTGMEAGKCACPNASADPM